MIEVNQELMRQARDTQYAEWTVDPCRDCGRAAVEWRCIDCQADRTYRTYVATDDAGGNREEIDADSMAEAVEKTRGERWAIVDCEVTVTEYTHTLWDDDADTDTDRDDEAAWVRTETSRESFAMKGHG